MRAPGGPGVAPGWGPGRRQALGAAPGPNTRVWFTLAGGHLSQVFYPAVDRPFLHSLRFVAAAPGEAPPEDVADASHEVRWVEPGIPSFKVESGGAEYSLTSEFIPDPETEALVIAGVFRPELPDVRLYLQAVPNDVADGQVLDREPPALAARHGQSWLVLIGPFGRCSAGYLDRSDLFVDLHDNDGEMTVAFRTATRGYIGLGAELAVGGGPFQVALGFGASLAAAEDAAHTALGRGATTLRESFARAWRAQAGPDRSLLKVAGDGGVLARCSIAVLRCLEDKQRPGAFISAPSAPWGAPTLPYSVVCNRDLFHAASALLDAGDHQSALRALAYLESTQRDDGSWPLRYRVNGAAEASGTDLGQVAFPVLLAWRLGVVGALDRDPYPRIVRRAAACLVNLGPMTEFDRWMDAGPGVSPSSLGAAVAALLAAAEFADDTREPAAAEHLRVVADYWQESVERWTFLEAEQRYVRLAADPEAGPQPSDAVGLEFLELVRRGLRQPHDPKIISSLARADSALRVGLPGGRAGWRRFTGDTYGEPADGSPWSAAKPGLGHAWPLLTGERAHLALAAGEQVGDYLRQLEACAGPELLLPEQVWDEQDRPEHGLAAGQATGSVTPFGWAHAEYLRLLAAFAKSSLPDLITPMRLRYLDDPPRRPAMVWHHGHRFHRLLRGRVLRIQLRRRGAVVWTADGWATSRVMQARNTGLDCWIADLPTQDVPAGAAVEWTVSYADGRWESGHHKLIVEGPMARALSRPSA
jgi:glucoamylase